MGNAQTSYRLLGNAGLWKTITRCHETFESAGIPHVICGGVAVCLHGYCRNTSGLDLLIRCEDSEAAKRTLRVAGLSWSARKKEFCTPDGVAVRFLMAGDRAGDDQDVKLPDPGDGGCAELIEGLPVLTLSRLIEVKLACGAGNLRRTHRDFADVVELIAIHELDGSFSRFLHKSVRKTFRELLHNAKSG
jgi:hypothetical protein